MKNIAQLLILEKYSVLADYNTHPGDEKKYFIGLKNSPRKCRFCQKSSPEVSFRKEAHAIPQLLGNDRIFSNVECDACNEKFSLLESNLGQFTAPFRTIGRIKGKTGIPSFKTKDAFARIDFTKQNIFEVSAKKDSAFVEINDNNKTITLNFTQHGYIPAVVYKCLCKIAISLLDDKDVDFFRNTIKWITSDNHEDNPFGKLFITTSFIPGNLPSLISVIVIRKKLFASTTPAIGEIVFGNIMIQFKIPTPNDKINTSEMEDYFISPLHLTKYLANKNLTLQLPVNRRDMSSFKKQTNNMPIENAFHSITQIDFDKTKPFNEALAEIRASANEILKNKN